MVTRFPPRLHRGDTIRVIAPSRSRALVMEFDHTELINRRFKELGLALSFGGHVDERDDFMSSAISSRVDDLHAAFADPEVDGILTVIGGFNSNELLPNLDWDLIAANPKVFCGFSDITALQNAILARTGLVTFSGPHWSTFGMRDHFELTLEWFVRALFDDGPWECQPARFWTDDAWFLNQDDRTVRENDGWWPIRAGRAEGRLVGGNLCTLNLLQGTANMPPLAGALLMVEDDDATDPATFARDLTSLLQLPDAGALAGLVVGRFQRASAVTRDLLEKILARQPALVGRPVLANADFGHTSPMMTWPVGGRGTLAVGPESRFTIGGD